MLFLVVLLSTYQLTPEYSWSFEKKSINYRDSDLSDGITIAATRSVHMVLIVSTHGLKNFTKINA